MYPKLNATEVQLVQNLLDLTYSLSDYETTMNNNINNNNHLDSTTTTTSSTSSINGKSLSSIQQQQPSSSSTSSSSFLFDDNMNNMNLIEQQQQQLQQLQLQQQNQQDLIDDALFIIHGINSGSGNGHHRTSIGSSSVSSTSTSSSSSLIQQQQQDSTTVGVVSSTTTTTNHTASSFLRKSTVRVEVPSSAHVSYIVGKQGSKIRQIRQETNTFIQTPVNGEEPIFIITGEKSQVDQAKQKILDFSKEYDFNVFVEACTYHDDSNRIRNNLFLPSRYIGLVVGKKGSMIKRIMELSGTTIITPKVNTENCFKIHGHPTQIRTAINLIKNHILFTSKVSIKEIKQNQFEYQLIIKSLYQL